MKGKRSKMRKRPKRKRQRMPKTQKTFENQFAPKVDAGTRFMTRELLSVSVAAKALRGLLRQENRSFLCSSPTSVFRAAAIIDVHVSFFKGGDTKWA